MNSICFHDNVFECVESKYVIKINFIYFYFYEAKNYLNYICDSHHISIGQSLYRWFSYNLESFSYIQEICRSLKPCTTASWSDIQTTRSNMRNNVGVCRGEGQQRFLHIFIMSFLSLRLWYHISIHYLLLLFLSHMLHTTANTWEQ